MNTCYYSPELKIVRTEVRGLIQTRTTYIEQVKVEKVKASAYVDE